MAESDASLNDAQLLRYSRHVLLDEIGIQGQQRISAARVLIVGAGGLGSPAALYLAAAGVGRLVLADGDTVDLTNLQRQILHVTARVGQPKVISGRVALQAMNAEVEVLALQQRLAGDVLAEQVALADVVLDCSDNFATRQAVNRACVMARRPLISGAAVRFDGQLALFDLRDADAPCYACLFGDQNAAMVDEACATLGIFAPLTGVIGTLQAAEALKLLAGVGESLSGRLLLFDALSTHWHEVRVPRDAACPVCASLR